MASIHPTAIVEPGAELGESVSIGPYSIVRAGVRIGEGTRVGPHCVIEGRTVLGRDNVVYQFCSLGAAPQDKKYAGEPTELHIGDRNTIREFCTFNLGTVQDVGVTRLGDDNWMMAYTHLAHDCQVGDKTIFANNAQIAGHVHVGDWAILGAYTSVHQFVRIGAHALTGMGTVLLQDVPPFATVSGNPAQARGFNLEGLKRRGFSAERVAAVKLMNRLIYRSGLSLDAARASLPEVAQKLPEAQQDVDLMAGFLGLASRGIVR
jgi:UDP-N-acetylglucosamine acyltransferase